MDKLTKEEIREAANNFFCSPEGRPLTVDEAAELICTVDAFEAGVEWAEEKYAQQFERQDNDSDEWIYWKEGLPEETSLVMVWVEEVNQAVKHYYNGQKWKNQENILLPEFYEIKFWQPLLHQPVKKINHV